MLINTLSNDKYSEQHSSPFPLRIMFDFRHLEFIKREQNIALYWMETYRLCLAQLIRRVILEKRHLQLVVPIECEGYTCKNKSANAFPQRKAVLNNDPFVYFSKSHQEALYPTTFIVYPIGRIAHTSQHTKQNSVFKFLPCS